MTLLVDLAIGATVLFAAAAALVVTLERAPAGLRRAVWRAAFVCVAVLPAVSLMPSGLGLSGPFFVAGSFSSAALVTSAAPASNVPWFVAAWWIGAAAVIARSIAGLAQVRRWSRASADVDGIRYSADVSIPVMWGFRRPEILLPAAAREWPAETRDLVLRHEQAHIAHHDWAWQMFARVVTAVLWFHPLAWVADRGMRREAERVADDAVIAAGTSAPDYASELVNVARATTGAMIAGVAMAQSSGLEARVRRVLDVNVRRRPASRWSVIGVAATLALLTVSIAAAQNDSRPQTEDEPVYIVGVAGVKSPRVLEEVKPEYPADAMKARIEGLVVLEAIVNKDGLPSDVKVIKGLDPSLDRAAIDALLQWRFEPATLKGKPVSVIVQVEFRFSVK